MKAETAYNVIQALNKEQRERLDKMLESEKKKKSIQKSKIWDETEVTEKLITLFQKRSKQNATQ